MEQNETTQVVPADDLTALISERIRQRAEKVEQMDRWDRTAAPQRRLRPLYWLTAVAACAALMLWLIPWTSHDYIEELGIGIPTVETYRGTGAELAEVETMIREQRYSEALARIDKALRDSELYLETVNDMADALGDEEDIYEFDAEMRLNMDLRWARIYLLVKTGENKQARRELKTYLRYPDYCSHTEEAKALLKKL